MRTPGKICVLGLGYIGLPTSAILACNGVEVLGVDVDEAVVRAVQAGDVPFAEPDLASFVRRAVDSGRLTAAARPGEAEAYIVAVPTPCGPDHAADLSYVEAAADSIARVLRPGALVLLESTSPPGTTRLVADRVAKARPDLVDGAGRLAVDFAYCPERVLPGQMMKELIGNDRIVGGLTRGAAERAAAVYETFCHGEILRTDAATAELAKLVENSYRDVNIAFANELSVVADSLGVDVWELIGLANHHPRVNILQPGPGVGGHCIAVDPWFIVEAAPAQARLIRAAREVNDAKPAWVCAKAAELLADAVPPVATAPVIAALGLAFKANVDDLRESPAREVVARLADAFPEGRIRVAEPYVDRLPPELAARPNVELVAADDVFAGADLAVMLVDHAAFARELLPVPEGLPTLDTRGAWK
ncbi:MAG: UDP-N-acetyl-D-mannosamine dehydrogenase [Bifidobacteriaceae bacterium]|jgi:UDP-N-acetyl-D-mannosaminuronic acid dehydrogenase|nr:UDP-N-acetyl-D-mannosamine dehydrogenase [Bifidobacteriaceae bacterium]